MTRHLKRPSRRRDTMRGMSSHYRFDYFDLPRRRWVRARYRAQIETIASRHGCFRLLGAPEIRGDGDPERLTASHVQRNHEGKG